MSGEIDRDLVAAWNAALPEIPIEDSRLAELPVELRQFKAAAEALRRRADADPDAAFDGEPASFAATLSALAAAPPAMPAKAPVAGGPPPAAGDDPAALSLVEAANRIVDGSLTSVAVVQAALARIRAADPQLHAFVAVREEAALEAAAKADAALAAGRPPGPLHGVPLAHKDMFYDPEVAVGCGSRIRQDFRAPTRATVLQRLADAGAVTVGALAMVEFAMGPHGYNGHLPVCRNPWDPDCIPCGSSSGSGVAVASRMVAGALGSDTGGSIRCPAAASGVTGILPTNGRVSRAGAMPMSISLDAVGPLARSARDCARLLSVIAGHDPADPTSAARPVPDYESLLPAAPDGALEGLRIGVPEGYFDAGIDPQVGDGLAAAREVLQRLGARIVPVRLPDLVRDVAEIHPLLMKAEGAANHQAWMRRHPDLYSDEVRKRLQAGFFVPASDYLQALKMRGPLARAFVAEVFETCDLLQAPVLARPVPTLEECLTSTGPAYLEMVVALTGNTKVVNYLGLPAIAVPCGFAAARAGRPRGTPLSFQLIGRPFDEAGLLRAAHAYQLATDWHFRDPLAG